MAASAYWVKLNCSMFSTDDRWKLIDAMPDADSILAIWLKILTKAGTSNAGGLLQVNEYIPIEADMLATLFNRPQETIDRALDVLTKFGFIDVTEGVEVADWYEYVNEDVMNNIRAKGAERTRKYRENQAAKKAERAAAKNASRHGDVTGDVTCNGQENEECRIENEEIKELKDNVPAEPPVIIPDPIQPDEPDEPKEDPIPYNEIIDYLNKVCGTSYKYADGHKKWIRARWNEKHRLEDFKHVIDVKHEEWHGTDSQMYLRPETLFGTKFDGYRNQRMKSQQQRRTTGKDGKPALQIVQEQPKTGGLSEAELIEIKKLAEKLDRESKEPQLVTHHDEEGWR